MKITDIEPYDTWGEPIKHTYLEFVGANPENISGKSNKFWEAAVFKRDTLSYVLVRRWGPYGKKGTVKEESFHSARTAKDALRKVRNQKWDKGYTKEIDIVTRLGTLVEDDA